MIYVPNHSIQASVALWLDNLFIEKGSGFANYGANFTNSSGSLNGFYTYAAPHRQFVYDNSIPGVNVPTGVYVNGVMRGQTATGFINFNQGSFLTTSPATVSGNYSFKEINTYFTNRNWKEILLEKTFKVNPKNTPNPSTFTASDHNYPCVFINTQAGENERICFDGLYSTVIPVRLTLLCDTSFLYLAATSLLRDQRDKFIPLLSSAQVPFDVHGSVTGSFDYSAIRDQIAQNSPNSLAFIRDVDIRAFPMEVNNTISNQLFGALIDIDFELHRVPSP